MIDLEKFDDFLNYELYLTSKIPRKIIIINYKKFFKQNKSILDFEQHLYNLGFYEITIQNISKYITNWNYRNEMDKKVMKNEKRNKR